MNTAATKQTTPGPGKQSSLDSMISSIPHTSIYVYSLFLMIGTLSPRRGILDGLSWMVNIANLIPYTGLNVNCLILPKNAYKLFKIMKHRFIHGDKRVLTIEKEFNILPMSLQFSESSERIG